MPRYTKELRQQIVTDFCASHDGEFNPQAFVKEVGASGPDHPAYGWFIWEDDRAAHQYRLERARMFIQGLRISVKVKPFGRSGTMTVKEAPLALSPLSDRADGGGYYIFDEDNPEHIRELCRQGAADLERWLERYTLAVAEAGAKDLPVERLIKALGDAGRVKAAAA
jgi:hypothetical protein